MSTGPLYNPMGIVWRGVVGDTHVAVRSVVVGREDYLEWSPDEARWVPLWTVSRCGVDVARVESPPAPAPDAPDQEPMYVGYAASFTCPRCGSAPGKPCKSVGPDSYARGAPLRLSHASRYPGRARPPSTTTCSTDPEAPAPGPRAGTDPRRSRHRERPATRRTSSMRGTKPFPPSISS